MDVVVVLFVLVLVALAFGFFGAWIAGEKGRDRNSGMVVGFLFGPLGCLILALLPAKEAPKHRTVSRSTVDWEERYEDGPSETRTWGQLQADKDEDNALRYLNGKD